MSLEPGRSRHRVASRGRVKTEADTGVVVWLQAKEHREQRQLPSPRDKCNRPPPHPRALEGANPNFISDF